MNADEHQFFSKYGQRTSPEATLQSVFVGCSYLLRISSLPFKVFSIGVYRRSSAAEFFASISADIRLLDDPGPALDVRLDEPGELLRTVADRLRALGEKLPGHFGRLQHLHGLRVDSPDDRLRRGRRREQRVPQRGFVARYALLGDGRKIGRRARARP